jgi:hypothetical protein
MDVHPPKNGIYRYWLIPISLSIDDHSLEKTHWQRIISRVFHFPLEVTSFGPAPGIQDFHWAADEGFGRFQEETTELLPEVTPLAQAGAAGAAGSWVK